MSERKNVRASVAVPTATRFPFDSTCTQIINTLVEKNWRCPGLGVAFESRGSDRHVKSITGSNFKLRFLPWRSLSRPLDKLAVSDISIPGQQLQVYGDEVSLVLEVKSGGRWLRYEGKCRCGTGPEHRHEGRRQPLLVYCNERRRPWWRPEHYQTEKVFEEFDDWLKRKVLGRL